MRDRFGPASARASNGVATNRDEDASQPEDFELVVSLCGLGEPLLNPNTPDFVRETRDAGFWCGLATNASVLDEQRAHAILDAGVNRVHINAGDRDEEYEDVYKLPFQKTRDNVVRFAEMAKGHCDVVLVLVDHRRDPLHLAAMQDYWQERGLHSFIEFDIINRGGALFVDDMQFETYDEIHQAREMLEARSVRAPACLVPFRYVFIGYDGNYYLCGSDWKKEVPLGSVFDTSLEAIMSRKLEHVTSREPICKSCNNDPVNRLISELRALETGEGSIAARDAMLDELVSHDRALRRLLDTLGVDAYSSTPVTLRTNPRTHIPIAVEQAPSRTDARHRSADPRA